MDSDDNAKGFENERSYSSLEPTTTTFLPSAIISIPNAFIPPLSESTEDFTERKKLNEALPVADGATEVDHETVPQRPKTAKGERPGSSKAPEDEKGGLERKVTFHFPEPSVGSLIDDHIIDVVKKEEEESNEKILSSVQAVGDDVWQVMAQNGEKIEIKRQGSAKARPQSSKSRPGSGRVIESVEDAEDDGLETLMLINFAKKPSMSRPVSAKSGSGRFNEMESRPTSAVSRGSRATSAMSNRGTGKETSRPAKTQSNVSSANHDSISGVVGRAQSASSTKATGHGTDFTAHQEPANNQKQFELQFTTPYTSLISQSHKSQTVRNNIDKYYIEQISLRRLKFVIDNKIAEPDHIQMMDMIEASEVPMDVVQHYFGSHVNSLHEIRVDLLQVIDRVKRKKSRQQLKIDKERQIREIGYNLLNRRVDDMTFTKGGLEGAQHRMRKLAIGREPITMHPYRPEPTTPYEILNILKVVDIRQKRAQKKRPDVAAMNPRSVTSEFSSQFGYETTRGAPQSDTHHDDKLGWKPVKARKDVSLESPKPKKPTRDIKTSFGARKLGTSAEGSGILAPRNVLCMLKPSQLARPRTVA